MFENIMNLFKKLNKKEKKTSVNSKDAAKERLHLVLMQDRANVSVDFLELMKQEIIDVIKKYIDVDESAIDVRLTNKENEDGTNGAPALYANIPIINIKNETRKVEKSENVGQDKNKKNDELEKENNEEKKAENEEKQEDIAKENKNENKEKDSIEEKNYNSDNNEINDEQRAKDDKDTKNNGNNTEEEIKSED